MNSTHYWLFMKMKEQLMYTEVLFFKKSDNLMYSLKVIYICTIYSVELTRTLLATLVSYHRKSM